MKQKPLPASDIRSNIGTWAVPECFLPSVANRMVSVLSPESFDKEFKGQYLQTSYFDTCDWNLRKARILKAQYLTLRIRAYAPSQGAGMSYPQCTYALSAKT